MIQNSSSSSDATARRRERDRLLRRGEILAAAERVFAASGFYDASIEQIAAEAGFAAGTIYLYFENKDALYVAVFVEKLESKVDYIEKRVLAAGDPIEGVREAVRAQLEFYDQHRAFFELVMRHHPGSMDRVKGAMAVMATFERHAKIVRALILRGQRAGLLRPMNSKRLAPLLMSMCMQCARDSMLHGASGPLARQAGLITDLFLNGAAAVRGAEDHSNHSPAQ